MPPGRKLPGKAGRARKARHEEGLAAVGDRLRDDMLAQMNQQMAEFTRELEKFARDHERDIQSNPTFRAKFHEMCVFFLFFFVHVLSVVLARRWC